MDMEFEESAVLPEDDSEWLILSSYNEQCGDNNVLEEVSNSERNDAPDIQEFVSLTQKQIDSDLKLLQSSAIDDETELMVIDDAIYVLIGAACGSPTIFDQLKKETKKSLIKSGIRDLNIDTSIEYFREQYISENPLDSDITDYILRVYRDAKVENLVSVLPLMCGTGKSLAITQLIIKTVKKVEIARKKRNRKTGDGENNYQESLYNGILVVTDSKERLKALWKENEKRRTEDNEFIRSHQEKWVTVMTDENSQDAEQKQEHTPVLLITTQRYFNWTVDEIKDHLRWGQGHTRPLIVFDEMPYLNEVKDISVKTLNDIDSALWLGLDNFVKLKDKMWCIRQWEKFRDRFSHTLFDFEREYHRDKVEKFYYEPETGSVTDDDERFFDIISKYKSKIRKNYSQEYQNMFVVKQLMTSWGIFSHRDADTGAYENKITVFIDNRKKLTNLGAKVIVLDGTGDISPIYAGQEDYVFIHKGIKFLRSLSYLTIKLVDYGTSRMDFYNDRNRIAPHVKRYLNGDNNNLNEMYYFTYKNKRGKFGESDHTAHFGDIKGRNSFNTATAIAQVGLNSLQPSQYLAHVLARNEDLRLTLVGKRHVETEKLLKQITRMNEYREFRARHILADVDQCLFRSAIRNSENEANVTYYLFYKQKSHQLLTRKIKERYDETLKANVIDIASEDVEKTWAEQADTAQAEIFRWMNGEWDGKPIKKECVLKKLKMKESTFDSAVRRYFKAQFGEFKKTARALGKKNGYYAKPVQTE